jgi:hypothetical protein
LTSIRKFDLTYVTVDSISEGVGSSQILPLLQRLAHAGLSINLISFEKKLPSTQILSALEESAIDWDKRSFEKFGYLGGVSRLFEMKSAIANTGLIHARSDIPAVAAILSKEAPVLWDIRSLWADQRAFTEDNPIKKRLLRSLRVLENVAGGGASAISTLTSSVVPLLENRHKHLPKIRTVVPTAVDLKRFQFVPTLPSRVRGLYSGTYNKFYDLVLSKRFIAEMANLQNLDVHWARPQESHLQSLNAGETSSFLATQVEMANVIPNYSFGMSVCKLEAGPSLMAAMPTKAGEFFACGRPMVVNAGLGDLEKYIREFNAGVVLDGNESDLRDKAQQLSALLADPETPLRCRALAEKYFDIDEGVRRYLKVYALM